MQHDPGQGAGAQCMWGSRCLTTRDCARPAFEITSYCRQRVLPASHLLHQHPEGDLCRFTDAVVAAAGGWVPGRCAGAARVPAHEKDIHASTASREVGGLPPELPVVVECGSLERSSQKEHETELHHIVARSMRAFLEPVPCTDTLGRAARPALELLGTPQATNTDRNYEPLRQ